MNRTSPSEVKSWCIERGFHPNKTLGQNFLIDRNILAQIVDSAGDIAGKQILEVGPGLGVLTEEMLRRGAVVTSVEKDTRLAAELDKELKPVYPSLRLIAGDMLEQDLDILLADDYSAFVSNLPYSVGTRILLEVVLHPRAPHKLVVLVQTEVAERFAAKENEDPRGQAGVWLQLFHDVKIVRKVKPSCFWPRPEVDSSIVVLTRHDRCTLSPVEQAFFFDLTKYVFMYRRKQLGAILRKAGQFVPDPDKLPGVFAAAELPPEIRPEAVSIEKWERLVHALSGLSAAR